MIAIPPPTIHPEDWANWGIGERMAQLNAYWADVAHVHEVPMGSNSGPVIDDALRFCGLGPGFAWCIALQVFNAHLCGVPDTSLPPVSVRASTVRTLDWCQENGKLAAIPLRGDIAIHVDSGGQFGHAGCNLGPVLHGDGTPVVGVYRAIEGNTNADGSAEGWEVLRKVRPLSYAKAFVRFW